jgi:hypothetical protein
MPKWPIVHFGICGLFRVIAGWAWVLPVFLRVTLPRFGGEMCG